jgi:serine/threonine-protein kinase ATR
VSQAVISLHSLCAKITSDQYNVLDTLQQCQLLTTIGLLPCAATRCLDAHVYSSDAEHQTGCCICDQRMGRNLVAPTITWNDIVPREEYEEILVFLSALVEDSNFRRTRKPRVLATHAIRRIINHLSDSDFLALGAGALAPWLMRSLQSSVRELRIASA